MMNRQLVLAVGFLVEAAMGFSVPAVKKWVIMAVEVMLILMREGVVAAKGMFHGCCLLTGQSAIVGDSLVGK
ncbi:hypothetical protein EV2_014344 [Malus domestica]